ncbi:NAD(P)/FAD-dependent oxidoreductase [Candidatus Contendibacter odensensis]|uniref:NAD(P)/FAD-dependent oxidoreductase n=1 Tax=Candidatus Contendibacter odensensis TaxID=1400860 RepID=UPI0018AC7C0D|nr:FAD-binding oxidoreductase [Candidatus Contendobacter odensis]
MRQTYADIASLEQSLGESLDLRRVGSLHLAAAVNWERELQELADLNTLHGVALQWLPPGELPALVPWLHPDPVRVALFTPDDGYLDPYRLAQAYAHAARQQGAILLQNVAVRELLLAHGRVIGVRTTDGDYHAPQVVLAAGAWSAVLSSQAGFGIPSAPVRSQYWIAAPHPLVPRRHPFTIIPEARAYTRPEVGGLLFGLREAQSVSVDPRTVPDDLANLSFGDDLGWESLSEGTALLERFLPALPELAIQSYITGPSTYTPDGLFVLGATPGVEGLLLATGCCGAGIAASGGIGRAVAALAADQTPPFDLSPFQPGRFGAVDPFDPMFRRRCEQARSGKVSG